MKTLLTIYISRFFSSRIYYRGRYSHWTIIITKTLVKLDNLKEPLVALINHGLEINLMSKDLYKMEKLSININYR